MDEDGRSTPNRDTEELCVNSIGPLLALGHLDYGNHYPTSELCQLPSVALSPRFQLGERHEIINKVPSQECPTSGRHADWSRRIEGSPQTPWCNELNR
jgi:hypothetical protein